MPQPIDENIQIGPTAWSIIHNCFKDFQHGKIYTIVSNIFNISSVKQPEKR